MMDPANQETCAGCDRRRPVSVRTRRGRCARDAGRVKPMICSICGRHAPCNISKKTGQPWCEAYKQRKGRCSGCGGVSRVHGGTFEASAESAHRTDAGNFVRCAKRQKLTRPDLAAAKWGGPSGVIDTETRWEQARWLLYDGALKPDDSVAGLLVLLYAQWPTSISRLIIEHVQVSEATGNQIAAFWQTVDLNALGGPVTWAGPQPAPVWLDAARDFTEYWTHHQQICDATGQAGLTDPAYLAPVLDTFMRALPHTLCDVTAPEGTALQVIVTGPSGGQWSCTRGPDRWKLQRQPHPQPAARLELDADTTWRLCTRGITSEHAAEHARIDGDQHLAAAALQIVSIIWSPPNPGAFSNSDT